MSVSDRSGYCQGVDPGVGRYALLSDCQSAALVGSDGSVDWWCAPRFDSRSCFARLLDPAAGYWSLRPVAEYWVERAYVEDTMVLRTVFHTAQGAVCLLDALALAPGARGHRIGECSPHVLVRLVEGLSGRVAMRSEFVPRLEYGLTTPGLRRTPRGVETVGGPDRLLLVGGTPPRVGPDGRATLDFVVESGRRHGFAAAHREGMTASDFPGLDPVGTVGTVEATTAAWRSWAWSHHDYRGFARDQVRRSALLLQALTYQPTGAIVAAATTSLPEVPGGGSNWDYRYGWLRDAAITLKALWIGACPDEAQRYFRWMALAGAGAGDHVQIMFGVGGERDLTEHDLDHLAGYEGSRPVRVGNDAWSQKQLDILGEVLEAAWVLREHLDLDADDDTARFLRGLADRAACSWREPDRNLTRTLALELAPLRINVNNLAPGMVLTPFNQSAVDNPEIREQQVQSIPWKRAAEPEEVARLAVFLASDEADYVTGSTYVIDGGLMQNTGQGA